MSELKRTELSVRQEKAILVGVILPGSTGAFNCCAAVPPCPFAFCANELVADAERYLAPGEMFRLYRVLL